MQVLEQDQRSGARVLIAIPALNEAPHILEVVRGLLREARSFAEFRLVVIDGGSHDATAAIVEALAAEHPEVHLLRNPARIQSAAVNLAARRFGQHADVLIRCDAHALYPAAFCARLVASLEHRGADAVVVPLDSLGSSAFQRAVAWASNSRVGTGGAAHRGGRVSGFVDHGHHAAFRMDSFRSSGGYDESFSHNEDAELDCRQRAFGARIYLDSAIRVGYYPRDRPSTLWRQYFHYGAGRSRTIRRHPGSLRLRQLLVPLHLLASLLALALSPWFAPLLAWPALYVAALIAVSLSVSVRERSLCGLMVGPAAAIMHTAWATGFLWTMVHRRERTWCREATSPLWSPVARGEHA